jgi:hypothetical protein
MAWEARSGRGRFYTRSRREGGKVRRQYIGAGPAAELAAAFDDWQRAERMAEAEARKVEQARWQGAQHALAATVTITDLLVQAALLVAGYHRHERGEWRRWKDEPRKPDPNGTTPGSGPEGAAG